MPIYLDCNATTPLEPAVREQVLQFLDEEFGNEGSRTHEFGVRAKQAVQRARDQLAAVVGATRDEVVFTSGATESNNIALLGLAAGVGAERRHIITSTIEHKAVLEPLDELERRGFAVTRLAPGVGGTIRADDVRAALRPDTFLVSLMHVNNETGIRQSLEAIAETLRDHPAYLHTDAAQGFGKDLDVLRLKRLDLISISGHKLYAPKGVGALIARRRGYERPPLRPLQYGGGQERGLRPGTLPVALIVGLGIAAELAVEHHETRRAACLAQRRAALDALAPLSPRFTGEQDRVLPHVLNVSFDGLDAEALIVGLKDLIAISNGSACTSTSYKPSHVLKAMGMSDDEANGCVRISWSHLSPPVDWREIAERIQSLR